MSTQLAHRYSERRFGTSCPRPLISRRSTTAGGLRSGWEDIIGLETGAVLARSVRRKVEGKRWNARALKMVPGKSWNPRPGEMVGATRYITRALIERYGPTEDCGGCFRKSQQHSERCRARFELLCAGEDGLTEVRAQEGAANSTRSSSTKLCLNINGSPCRWRRHWMRLRQRTLSRRRAAKPAWQRHQTFCLERW